MTEKSNRSAKHTATSDTSEAVDAFMAALDHPFKVEIEAIRQAILGADPRIREGIKWNAPSFRTTEYFATTHLAKDRACLVFTGLSDFRAKEGAFTDVVRQWIRPS